MRPSLNNICYAQSGGSTAVINASASGLIQAALANEYIGKVFVAQNGILGVLNEELIDMEYENEATILGLAHTPGSAFGSCRHKLSSTDNVELKRIFEVFKAHNIGFFFYNGGNDSQDTILKIANYAEKINYPLNCIGIPKTIDNDLPITDNCPGYASSAKFLATITQEIILELKGMSRTSTQVFVLEVMGRHSGWLAAACGYTAHSSNLSPHIILFPEITFNPDTFIKAVEKTVKKMGYCMIVTAEGIKDKTGSLLCKSKNTDAFGHHQLGGIAPNLANLIQQQLGYANHWAVPDYIQRSSRHLAAAVDVKQAISLGENALERALNGESNIMLTIERLNNKPYQWKIGSSQLSNVANQEKCLPPEFIRPDGYGITSACLDYLRPLITGETFPPFSDGLPNYIQLQSKLCAKKLNAVTLL